MTIFRMVGKPYDEFERFSGYVPEEMWKRIKSSGGDVEYIRHMQRYIPEELQDDFEHCFKEYASRKDQYANGNGNGSEEDEVRETRKTA